MATYKAVMRPALEYASSVWSPIASSTSINKLQVMQNAVLLPMICLCFCMLEVISSFRSLRAGSQVFALFALCYFFE